MATLTYKLKIPNKIYRFRWENIKRYAEWVFKPHRCYVCNTRLVMSHPEYQYHYKDTEYQGRILAQWDIESKSYVNRKHICASCLAEHVKDENAIPKHHWAKDNRNYSYGDLKNTCDCCKEKKRSFKWTSFKIPGGKTAAFILGDYCSWNSAHYCADCIRTAITEGTPKTGIWSSWYGTHVCIQQNGLPVVDGKVRFPDR